MFGQGRRQCLGKVVGNVWAKPWAMSWATGNVWAMSWAVFGQCRGQCLGNVWIMSWAVFGQCRGQCLGNVWAVFGQCLGSVWVMFGQCLGNVLGSDAAGSCPNLATSLPRRSMITLPLNINHKEELIGIKPIMQAHLNIHGS